MINLWHVFCYYFNMTRSIEILLGVLFLILVFSCNATSKATDGAIAVDESVEMDTIRIANEELEYEIIILEIGFNSWLVTQRPITYYPENTLAIKNRWNVQEYNRRVNQPFEYDTNLYVNLINYDFHVDYGKEVNYLLYMYFEFFQEKYNQKLLY